MKKVFCAASRAASRATRPASKNRRFKSTCFVSGIVIMGWIQSVVVVFSLIASVNGNNEVAAAKLTPQRRRDLPEKVLIGYTSGNHENVWKAVVKDGVNMVIWAFMEIVATNDNDEVPPLSPRRRRVLNKNSIESVIGDRLRKRPEMTPSVKTNLELEKIEALIEQLDENGYSHVVHLVSFGGWDGPHLDPSLTAHQWYSGWKSSIASDIFHGIDWDLEGADDVTSENNVFTVNCLENMGEISRLMKNDGYIVTIAPPQSYLNFNDSNFSRYVNLSVPTRRWQSKFEHFGDNVYAYLLATHGDYIDLISIQLYESYSNAAMSVYYDGMTAEDYLFSFIRNHAVLKESEFYVDFSQDESLNMQAQLVQVPLSKLVIGLANGWAFDSDQNKTLFMSPLQCQGGYLRLKDSQHGDLTPRGFMFWTIDERGTQGVYLAREIHKFLHDDL